MKFEVWNEERRAEESEDSDLGLDLGTTQAYAYQPIRLGVC